MNLLDAMVFYNDRPNLKKYTGPLFIWDIDKTYLKTRFSSLGGLVKIPAEWAVDKVAFLGIPQILRGLRQGQGPEVACFPLYFLSSSPPFLKNALEEKALQDGVEADGWIFKDWFKLFTHLKIRPFVFPAPFKLLSLLARKLAQPVAKEYLFGDDVEQDPEVYLLYSALLKENHWNARLKKLAQKIHIRPKEQNQVTKLLGQLPKHRGLVQGVWIHHYTGRNLENLKRLFPTLHLYQDAQDLSVSLDHFHLLPAKK